MIEEEESFGNLESFHARLQKQMRIQIPRLLRWKYKLDPGDVMKVMVAKLGSFGSKEFLAKMQQGGRITVPNIYVELEGLKLHELVKVDLWLPPEKAFTS